MKYDYLIVGGGLFGSVFARCMADKGKTSLIIDKRKHIAGNCYTEKMEGTNVHMYGSHIFHTSNQTVWEFVNRFAKFNNFVNRLKANCDGKIYSFPVNLLTLCQLWGISNPEEARAKLEEVRTPNDNPKNAQEWLYSNVGEEITELFYRGYTEKHWMKPLSELPISIYSRLPIRTNFDDNYYNHSYQGIPIGGYTKMFENILDHENIKVELNTDFFQNDFSKVANKTVFTGPIDEYYDYRFGELDYKTVSIEFKTMDTEDYQGCAVISHPQHNVKYTKSVEHKHFENADTKKSIVTFEYPKKFETGDTKYYPLTDKENTDRYLQYKNITQEKVIFGGRLAEFKYYDMHHVVASAMKKASDEK